MRVRASPCAVYLCTTCLRAPVCAGVWYPAPLTVACHTVYTPHTQPPPHRSVGVPSSIYDTVRSLRQARALRLGALQRKLPPVHLLLLWLLALIQLSSFPVLGAGTQTLGGYDILTVEGGLFGLMTFGIVLTLNVVGELYAGSGGAYNVDEVLGVMVRGLDEELDARMRDLDREPGERRALGAREREEVERRRGRVLPSPAYYPLRYSTGVVGGEDSAEANSI